MDEALYNCNWTMAPLQMRKLILLYKIRMTKPTFIRGGPFFIMNWELFGEVSHKGYTEVLCTTWFNVAIAGLQKVLLSDDHSGGCAVVKTTLIVPRIVTCYSVISYETQKLRAKPCDRLAYKGAPKSSS